MKVVINRNYGGFNLSREATERYIKEKGLPFVYKHNEKWNCEEYVNPNDEDDTFWSFNIERTDPILIQIVEEMGEDSWGEYSRLKVIKIPDEISWIICDYDGMEHIAEKHRTWS